MTCVECPAGWGAIVDEKNQLVGGSAVCLDLGEKKPSDCKDDEYFNTTLLDCERCPFGSSCLGSITWPQVKAKFGWQQCSNDPKKFEQCSFPGACLGGPNPALSEKFLGANGTDLARCPDCKALDANLTSCSNCTQRCNAEYVDGSRLCGQCAPQYSLDGLSGKCELCPSLAQNVGFSVLGILLGVVGAIVLIQVTLSDGGDLDESDGAKSILMSYIQLLSLLPSFPIAWPDIFISIFKVGGAITAVGQHLVNFKCMSSGTSEADVFFTVKIIWAAAPPVLMLLCLMTWHLLAALFQQIQCSAGHPRRCCRVPFCFTITNLPIKIKTSWVALLYLLWPNLCSETFSLFACRSVCDDDVMFLRADLNEVCWQADSRHAYYALGLGLPMLLLYVIGLPVAALYRVWHLQVAGRSRAAAQMTLEMRENKRRRGSIIRYGESVMNDDHKIYGMFFSAFHENTWWWESTIAGRKIIIAMIGVFGANMESMQVHLTLMLVVMILLITAQVRPFGGLEHSLLQRLEMASLMAIFLTLWAGSVFYLYPKCQDPMKPEGVTLAWCDALSVTVGIVDIVMVFVLIGCFVWLKARGRGGDDTGNAEDDSGGNMLRAVMTALRDQVNWFQSRMMSEEQRQARVRARTVEAADNNALENPAVAIEMPPRSTFADEVKVAEEGEDGSRSEASNIVAPFMSPPPPLQMNFRRQVEERDMHSNPMERNWSSKGSTTQISK